MTSKISGEVDNQDREEQKRIILMFSKKLKLVELNTSGGQNSILIQTPKHEKRLYESLILEKIIELNPNILDNISNFTAGLQIIFPSKEVIMNENFILDKNTAKLFYEVNNYNNEFDAQFISGINDINDYLESLK